MSEAMKNNDSSKVEAVLRDARNFVEKHLLKWFGDCLDEISRKAATQYYKSCAALYKQMVGDLYSHLE